MLVHSNPVAQYLFLMPFRLNLQKFVSRIPKSNLAPQASLLRPCCASFNAQVISSKFCRPSLLSNHSGNASICLPKNNARRPVQSAIMPAPAPLLNTHLTIQSHRRELITQAYVAVEPSFSYSSNFFFTTSNASLQTSS